MRLYARSVCCLVGVVFAAACSPYTQHGETLYHEGRYIEAAEVFEVTEAQLREYPASERAEYGVYRGLTYLRLDDLYNARQWLGYAFAMERRDASLLDSYDQSVLARGWSELERRKNSAPTEKPDESRIATTDTSSPRGLPVTTNGRRFVPAN